MKWTVSYSRDAKEDIRSIYSYIAFELLAPDTAANQYRRIAAAILKLEEMPMRFPLYKDEPWHSLGMRWFPVDNYLVFYFTDETTLGMDEILKDPEITDNYTTLLTGQSFSLIKVKDNEEMPLGALYISTRDSEEDSFPGMAETMEDTLKAISDAAPEYCYLFSVKFGTIDPNGVAIPDLTDLSLEEAKAVINNSGLSVGNIEYEDTSNDENAIVYHQAPPPGYIVEQGTAVDITVKKK